MDLFAPSVVHANQGMCPSSSVSIMIPCVMQVFHSSGSTITDDDIERILEAFRAGLCPIVALVLLFAYAVRL